MKRRMGKGVRVVRHLLAHRAHLSRHVLRDRHVRRRVLYRGQQEPFCLHPSVSWLLVLSSPELSSPVLFLVLVS